MSDNFRCVGKSVPKIDSRALAAGRIKFSADFELPGMLHAKILGSPHAHARIKSIDTSKAEKIPGVEAVITYKDVPDVLFNPSAWYPNSLDPQDKRVLNGRVRYVGEPVAVVAAVDQDTAEEALELIDVEYEVLPAVFDPEEAMKPGAPKIHDLDRNIAAHVINSWGDVEEGFKEADYVFEDRYTASRQAHAPMEPHACVATCQAGRITVYTASQAAFKTRRALSDIFKVPNHMVRVVNSNIGGGFGGKDQVFLEPICCVLSMKTGKPVKITLTRAEVFAISTTRHPCVIYLKTGVKKDGALTARQVVLIVSAGGYASHSPLISGAASAREVGLYMTPNFRYESYCAYTNTLEGGAFRGFGNPQQSFAVESQLDAIAERLGMDPTEIRLKNGIRLGQVDRGSGLKLESCGLQDCIRKSSERIGWKAKVKGPRPSGVKRRGVGIACEKLNSGAAPYLDEFSSSVVKINEDGTVNLLTGAVDIGQGILTALAQIVAEELGIAVKDVQVAQLDTDAVPSDRGAYASGSMYISGEAARLAAIEARKKLLEAAAKVMKVKAANLEIRNGKIQVKGKPGTSRPIGKVVPEEQIVAAATYKAVKSPPSFGAHCMEVEVDTETGQLRILRAVCAHDVGRAINPRIVEGQIEGATVQGLGYALTEDLKLSPSGKVLNAGFTDYKLPHARDFPDIEPIIVEAIGPTDAYGAKGVGESPIIPPAPAIANAVYNAVGVRIKELPITSEKVLRALKKI